MNRDTTRRFAYIETCLYWGGGITASQLARTFEITRQNAQKCLEAYRLLHPHQMIYQPSLKCHIATQHFQVNYISAKPDTYLDYLRGNQLAAYYWKEEDWAELPVYDLDALYRPYLDSDVIRIVVQAIQNQKTLYLYYHSKASGYEYVAVAPHHLVYTSRRYHVRAYSFSKNKFIDLVLSRMLKVEFADYDWVSSEEDKDWSEYVEFHFTPNPHLPKELKETLLLDFRLENNIYTIKTRRALKDYIERDMQQPDWLYRMPLWLPVKD